MAHGFRPPAEQAIFVKRKEIDRGHRPDPLGPWIGHCDTRSRELSGFARDDRKSVVLGGGGDDQVPVRVGMSDLAPPRPGTSI